MTTMATPDAPTIERVVDLPALVAWKSHFLFGPRQTGKSFLIRHTLPGASLYDLLDSPTYLALSRELAESGGLWSA
jgi:hypothetical protein